jgi:hypothetical protein
MNDNTIDRAPNILEELSTAIATRSSDNQVDDRMRGLVRHLGELIGRALAADGRCGGTQKNDIAS